MQTPGQPSVRHEVQVVAFTKDWNDVPTCTTHILRCQAETRPVLWICSIGTRKPQARSGKDWRRLAGRVATGFRRSVWQENGLRVLRPLLVPKAESRLARWLNRQLFRRYLRRELPRGFGGTVEFWCFVPNAVDLLPVRTAFKGKVIYYCADDWTRFHNLDGAWMAQKERLLLRRSDMVFATSRSLEARLGSLAPVGGAPVVYMPHGVDYMRFAAALDRRLPLPADLAVLPRPVIGFYGNLHPWVDSALVAALAAARPQWSFVLIGEIYSDVTALRACSNIHLMGRREHAALPDYCRGWAAAIIPYDMSHARMESVNPVKTKELLAAGVPVVASRVPALEGYGDDILCCERLDTWLSALERQIRRSPAERLAMSERVHDEDWHRKVQQIRRHVDEVS